MSDEIFMARALKLAEQGRFTTSPNPNVGCVIVRDGIIVGEGWHQRAGEGHAEVNALRQAGNQAKGATAYVTLEPCSHFGRTPPCCEALIQAGIKRLVAAMQDPNPQVAGRGLYRLQQAGIEVSHGLMANQAEQLNRGFLKRMRTGFPWVQLKLGASLDGRTAMANGESQWITSREARRDVQRFRATSSAILTSSNTVIADDPALTVRWAELDPDIQRQIGDVSRLRQPVRILLDRQQRVSHQAALYSQPGETWVFNEEPPAASASHVRYFHVPLHKQQCDPVALMLLLGKQQINDIWIEAGATLAGGLLAAGVVDELILYLSPKLMGDAARGLCHLPGLEHLADVPVFRFEDIRAVGEDLRLILRPA